MATVLRPQYSVHFCTVNMTTVAKSFENTAGDDIIEYCTQLTAKAAPLQKELQAATLERSRVSQMLGAPEVFAIGQSFLRLINAKKVLDIGTFTGASALAWALALSEDGKIISMDIDHSDLTEIGLPIIRKDSSIANKIDFRLGKAVDILDELIKAGDADSYDFAFIDADKPSYTTYYKKSMKLLRKGGVILVDNALWNGSVVMNEKDVSTKAIDDCNRTISNDNESSSFLINVGDGLHVAFKL